ncbi:GntR family transcriptional regulator [Carboxydothermus islandicus]|uniref:GntR family transcriptional regulator n=1 Tax=Carboxydothermus islandicus TaxID=661089 RepID=A0A1L8D205_9THEO|nr:GntR family transcriptional regulator [Carboxydothermus islandicus]GAV25202.1 GntR family transcriptional regulator [Carboxydothermus islandicus]
MNINFTGDNNQIDKNSVIPVYYQLARIIERDIFEGRLKPGDAIPPENELVRRYGISRMTVRRAIAELINSGLVYTQKGKGTFVAKPQLENMVFELGDFHEEIKKRGMKPGIKLLGTKIVRADELLAKKLEIPLNTTCLYLRLLISANDEPLIFENKYMVYTKKKPILELELKDPSLANFSNLVAAHGESFPVVSKMVLHASVVTEEEAEVLGVKLNTPVFVVEQTLYDSMRRPVGWGKSVFRGDRFKFTSYVGWTKYGE